LFEKFDTNDFMSPSVDIVLKIHKICGVQIPGQLYLSPSYLLFHSYDFPSEEQSCSDKRSL